MRPVLLRIPMEQVGAANGRPYESLIGSQEKREKTRVPENTGQKI